MGPIYVKMEFEYYSVFILISAVYNNDKIEYIVANLLL